ncbi:Hypp622 [Branchiostoma lanceolatum]|uniref:Hypp622 protein n=1 Tax=Branchiostoma lanceolatum TaxID=7740 RepID=A0A8J9YR67_BRALA|nr:Hypp622 [Branchiostoma lanceolatum]
MAGEAEACLLEIQQMMFIIFFSQVVQNQRRQERTQRRRRLRRIVRNRRVLGLNAAALAAAIAIADGGGPVERLVWTKERSSQWWEHLVLETYSNFEFYRRFRMRKDTFQFLELAREINGTNIPVKLLGDAAYPHLNWLLKAYPDNGHLTPGKQYVTYRLSRARMTIECAFGRLKGRWRCLSKRIDVDLDRVPTIVAACCVLHNVCEVHGEQFDEQLYMPAYDNDNLQAPQGRDVPNVCRDALTRMQNVT